MEVVEQSPAVTDRAFAHDTNTHCTISYNTINLVLIVTELEECGSGVLSVRSEDRISFCVSHVCTLVAVAGDILVHCIIELCGAAVSVHDVMDGLLATIEVKPCKNFIGLATRLSSCI